MSEINNTRSPNTVWHATSITRAKREEQHGHRSAVLWFTGLSGSGKSSLAHALEEKLYSKNIESFVLDGDNVRHGLCADLGFTRPERHENIRRVAETAKLFFESGKIIICAFISPYRSDRDFVRRLIGVDNFIEIYCDAPLEVCEQRDVKGLYKKARSGEIKNYTGISAPYEIPEDSEIILNTTNINIEENIDVVINFLKSNKYFRS